MSDGTQLDYSIYYRNWHDESPAHVNSAVVGHVRQLDPLLADAPRGAALDVGCGMGFALLALHELGFAALGLERDPAQAKAAARIGARVIETTDAAGWLRERPGIFECVTLLDVLEHVPKQEQIALLVAIRTSLTGSGRLIVTVPNASSPLAAHWRYQDWTHTSAFTERSIEFVLYNAGFSDVKIIRTSSRSWRGVFGFWRRGWAQLTRRLLVNLLWRNVLKAYLGTSAEANAPLELNLTVVATGS